LNVKEVKYSKEPISGDDYVTFGEYEKYVTLNIAINEELEAEGLRNDFLRKYRDLRKKSGLKLEDKISLKISFEDDAQEKALREYIEKSKEELSVKEVSFGEKGENSKEIVLNEKKIYIEIG
jgi:hypothetical protein